ncbi:MAG TPA: LLM class F420-dependent oxidoreductase [Candidatus Limnocylindrales bacterium]|nr:LLM class F420-dependent oxidoreductase [Candidatus Limnocylindrales bacterium]
MKFGLQVPSFTWPGGTPEIGPTLGRVVTTAEAAGFDSLWVMDHFFQIRGVGPKEDPMLEGMTALGWIAARTTKPALGLMVGGIHYRNPALWIKSTTTLDVLSGGRAWFGIGAAWNEEESRGLGFPFPALGVRFEMLEETLQMAHRMWTGERGTEGEFEGRHYRAERLLNSPQSIQRPRIPIMIGGGGEQKTLRLVAQYGDACNVGWGNPESIAHKVDVLRGHCEAIGRPIEEIEITTLLTVDIATRGGSGRHSPAQIVDWFGSLADVGVEHVLFSLPNVDDTARLERLGADVLPQARGL